jgi:hypothetical protein
MILTPCIAEVYWFLSKTMDPWMIRLFVVVVFAVVAVAVFCRSDRDEKCHVAFGSGRPSF